MRLLVDTHTLFWSIEDPAKVSPAAMAALHPLTNDVLLSAASIWELAIKVSQGKIALSMPYRLWMDILDKKVQIPTISIGPPNLVLSSDP